MKNYLFSIDNELHEYYDKFIVDAIDEQKTFEEIVKEFSDNVITLIDYYITPIVTNGKSVIQKRLGLTDKHLTEKDIEFIQNYKLTSLVDFNKSLNNAIIHCFDERTNNTEFYNQLSEIIISYCIKLFKLTQLIECKNNNIKTVKLFSDNEISCVYCQTLSKFDQEVDNLIENIDELHPLCKLIINVENKNSIDININGINFYNLPINAESKVKNFVRKLQISIPNLLSNKNFEFIENIFNDINFISLMEKQFDKNQIEELTKSINNQIISFDLDNKILVSNKDLKLIEYIITKYLLKDKLKDYDELWWKDQYYKRQDSKYIGNDVAIFAKPFITYEAEQSPESYFNESIIYYIINPIMLKSIDNDGYSWLKKHIFNGIEFLRG